MLRRVERCGLLVLGLWAGWSAGVRAQGSAESLAGTWKFSSTKTREAASKRMSSAPAFTRDDGLRNSGANNRSRSPGAGGGESGGGSGGTGGGARAELGPLALYARPLPELVIVQTDSTFTISDPRGTSRIYFSDGRRQREPLLAADSLEIVAKWKDGKLTTERKLGSFGVIKEVYSLDTTNQLLLVDVKLSAPQLVPPLEEHWIYEKSQQAGGGGDN